MEPPSVHCYSYLALKGLSPKSNWAKIHLVARIYRTFNIHSFGFDFSRVSQNLVDVELAQIDGQQNLYLSLPHVSRIPENSQPAGMDRWKLAFVRSRTLTMSGQSIAMISIYPEWSYPKFYLEACWDVEGPFHLFPSNDLSLRSCFNSWVTFMSMAWPLRYLTRWYFNFLPPNSTGTSVATPEDLLTSPKITRAGWVHNDPSTE